MTARQRLPRLIVSSVLGLTVCACGTSGSNPPVLPEVHFLVTPLGSPASFTVGSIVTGGLTHPSIENQEYDGITGPVDFVVEGAFAPYSGTFSRAQGSTHEIRVELSFVRPAGLGGDFVDTKETSAAVEQVTVLSAPGPTPRAPTLETRVDLCVPAPGTLSCLTTDPTTKSPVTDPGAPAQPFGGSIGDAFSTHILAGALRCISNTCTNALPMSPTIYFLEDAQQSVIGVFQPLTVGQVVVVRLYLNGVLNQGATGSENVVVRTDL
jgi:hypothetical protein